MNYKKISHFYVNKYIASPLSKEKYYLSYSFKYKALWFRTYKVASRTINQYFIDNSNSDEYIYSSKVGYLPARYANYFNFAFVRNPVSKLKSCWKDKVLSHNYFGFDGTNYKEMQEFENFVSWVSTVEVNSSTCDEHLRSQSSLIDLNNIDFLGRFENFNEDFGYVADKIGLPLEQKYHKNKTKKVPLTIRQKVKKKIIDIYHKDFALFYPEELHSTSDFNENKIHTKYF